MDRNRIGALLFALALAVQAAAPAAAAIAIAKAARDFGVVSTICLQSGGDPAGERELPGHHNRHCDACTLCEACCNGVAPPSAWPRLVGMAPVQSIDSSWTVADRALPTPLADDARRARAPPALS